MSLGRSILVFFGALIFSALLWSYVRLSAAYEADVDLPVRLNSPKGYALSSGLPERVHARIRGAGWQILLMNFSQNSRFQFDLTDRAIHAPVITSGQTDSKEDAEKGLLVIHSDEISNAAMLPSELRVLKVEPDSLQLHFSKSVEKRIMIAPNLDVQPGNGYVIVGTPSVSPAAITVTGAPNVLDSLKSFPTKLIIAHKAKEDIDQSVDLSDSLDNFITLPNIPKISVHVDIQAIGERTLTNIPILVDALPPQYEMILVPGTVALTVRGGVDALSKLALSTIHAHVMFDPALLDTTQVVVPKVDVPAGITFLSEEPRAVKFIIRKRISSTHVAP